MSDNPPAPAVSAIIIFLNAERFMDEAICSIFEQTFKDWELILVDDGSTDGSTTMAQAYAAQQPDRVRYVEHEGHWNRGMSASRRLGAAHARGTFLAFLDADDVWRPDKLEAQVTLLRGEPRASMVYGAPLYWHEWIGNPDEVARDEVPGVGVTPNRLYEPPELLFATAPFGSAPVPCPSDVLIRREAVERVGGFEAAFRGAYEDVAFFVKMYLDEPVFVADACWTHYRIHQDSCMAVAVRERRYDSIRVHFLNWFEEYLSRKGLAGTDAWSCLQTKLAPYRRALTALAVPADDTSRLLTATPNPVPADSSATLITWRTPQDSPGQVCVSHDGGHETLFGEGPSGKQEANWINAGSAYEFRLYADAARSEILDRVTVTRLVDPGVGRESFGSLRRVVPISRTFGFDRGQPIDRYYIDAFLSRHADDVRGHTLEIGESTYTKRFGGPRVSAVDVLHVSAGNPEATIVADLTDADHIPSATFDCVLLIQTLQLIFDTAAAIRTLHRILKPGGVLLATFPGLSQRAHDEWGPMWYWGFTSLSTRRLFADAFPANGLSIQTYGNVLATTAFLYGLAATELSVEELNYVDPSYEMLIAVRGQKAAIDNASAAAR